MVIFTLSYFYVVSNQLGVSSETYLAEAVWRIRTEMLDAHETLT
jgi:hypothetical protein